MANNPDLAGENPAVATLVTMDNRPPDSSMRATLRATVRTRANLSASASSVHTPRLTAVSGTDSTTVETSSDFSGRAAMMASSSGWSCLSRCSQTEPLASGSPSVTTAWSAWQASHSSCARRATLSNSARSDAQQTVGRVGRQSSGASGRHDNWAAKSGQLGDKTLP